MDKIYLPYHEAKGLIKEADVLLFRGTGIVPFFLKRIMDSMYSHVGLASWVHDENGNKTQLECVEFKEWRGGRAICLERYVRMKDKRIDVYRASEPFYSLHLDTSNEIVEEIHHLNGRDITNCMRSLTGLPYGWPRIFWLAKYHFFIFSLFRFSYKHLNDSLSKDIIYPICSTAVAHCYQKNYVDLIHNKSNMKTVPPDISNSTLLNYLFTLTI